VGVEKVLTKALARDAEGRYAGTLEFGDAFGRAAAGEDIEEGGGGIMARFLKR
jgi:hypothetical protein